MIVKEYQFPHGEGREKQIRETKEENDKRDRKKIEM